jgi:hypothetical protein
MIEICVQCKTEIPTNACQQGQKIDGEWYPLHVGCADVWANELIPVWVVDWDGEFGHVEPSLDTIKAYISELEPDERMTVQGRPPMKRIEYLNLPEAT